MLPHAVEKSEVGTKSKNLEGGRQRWITEEGIQVGRRLTPGDGGGRQIRKEMGWCCFIGPWRTWTFDSVWNGDLGGFWAEGSHDLLYCLPGSFWLLCWESASGVQGRKQGAERSMLQMTISVGSLACFSFLYIGNLLVSPCFSIGKMLRSRSTVHLWQD